MTEMPYPIDFDVPVDDEERSRGLAVLGLALFVKTLLLIPHLFALLAFFIAVQFIVWIGFWYVLVTGTKPPWIDAFSTIYLRWSARVYSWFTSITDSYPTFGADDNHPAQVSITPADEPQSRLLALAGIVLIRSLLALPHLFILTWLTLGTLVAAWFGYLMIVINGRLPLGLHIYFVGFERWTARTWAFIAGITDRYPPFRLGS